MSADHGDRLDRFLSRRLSVGLRTARRLAEESLVRVNGRLRAAAHKVKQGDTVRVFDPQADQHPEPALVWFDSEYAVFFKPPGLHTAAIAGSPHPSLEAWLTGRTSLPGYHPPALPDWLRAALSPLERLEAQKIGLPVTPTGFFCSSASLAGQLPTAPLRLLTRLDRDTGGLILAARSPQAEATFRRMEAAGEVVKEYLAIVEGRLEDALTCSWKLDTADRRITRVLAEDGEPERRTEVEALARAPEADETGLPRTLVRIRIRRGARHQIRAHLAQAGYPLAGDPLYGGQGHGYFLCHVQTAWGVREVRIPPHPPQSTRSSNST